MATNVLTSYQTAALQARAYRAVKAVISTKLKEHGLTYMHWSILGLSHDYTARGGVKVSQLADLLKVEISLITTTLNALEPKGLVQRVVDERDSRVKRVVTTRQGEKTVKKIESILQKAIAEWQEGINEKQLEAYIKTLQLLAKKK